MCVTFALLPPPSLLSGDSSPSPNELAPTFDQIVISSRQTNTCPQDSAYKCKSLPLSKSMNSLKYEAEPMASPIPRRAHSPSPNGHSANTLSPVIRRRSNLSQSPKTSVKNFFRLSGSHLLDAFSAGGSLSAHNSPILGRRKHRQSSALDSEYVFQWMEGASEGGERHWQQVLEREGEWVYFWHILQPKLY